MTRSSSCQRSAHRRLGLRLRSLEKRRTSRAVDLGEPFVTPALVKARAEITIAAISSSPNPADRLRRT